MVRNSILLAGLLLLPFTTSVPALALAADPRVGILIVGSDVVETGRLQHSLEEEVLSTRGVRLMKAEEIAAKIGKKEAASAPTTRALTPETTAEIKTLMKQVQASYFDGETGAALTLFGDVKAIFERLGETVPVQDQVDHLIWKAALLHANGKVEPASNAAVAALTLQPALKADAEVFRPSFVQLLETAADKLDKTSVTFTNIPEGATIEVDERKLAKGVARVSLPRGEHTVVIRKAGYQRLKHEFTLGAKAQVLRLPPPLALESQTALSDMALTGNPTPGQRVRVSELSKQLGVDGLIIVALTDKTVQGAMWWEGEPARKDSPALEFSEADVDSALRKWMREELVAGRASGVGRLAQGWESRVEAGVLIASRARTVSGSGFASYGATVAGTGPRIVYTLSRASLVTEIEGTFVTYQISNISVLLPDGATGTTNGGFRIGARGSGGYQRLILRPNREPIVLSFLGGVTWESHTIDDPADATGPTNLFPRYTRIAVEARAKLGYQLARRVGLHAGLGLSPWGIWSEDPDGATGNKPYPAGATWAAGLNWRPAQRWNVNFDYLGDLRFVQFSGTGKAPLVNAVEDARWIEHTHAFNVGVQRQF